MTRPLANIILSPTSSLESDSEFFVDPDSVLTAAVLVARAEPFLVGLLCDSVLTVAILIARDRPSCVGFHAVLSKRLLL